MSHFNHAVNKPYGYLLVDLKPTTVEGERLCQNTFAEFDDEEKSINISELGAKRSQLNRSAHQHGVLRRLWYYV